MLVIGQRFHLLQLLLLARDLVAENLSAKIDHHLHSAEDLVLGAVDLAEAVQADRLEVRIGGVRGRG